VSQIPIGLEVSKLVNELSEDGGVWGVTEQAADETKGNSNHITVTGERQYIIIFLLISKAILSFTYSEKMWQSC